MNIKINAVKFRIDEKLELFVNEKVSKLNKHVTDLVGAEVHLKVDKPETENNKVADIRLSVRGNDLFATKQADSFEQAVTECVDALKTQIEKYKERK